MLLLLLTPSMSPAELGFRTGLGCRDGNKKEKEEEEENRRRTLLFSLLTNANTSWRNRREVNGQRGCAETDAPHGLYHYTEGSASSQLHGARAHGGWFCFIHADIQWFMLVTKSTTHRVNTAYGDLAINAWSCDLFILITGMSCLPESQ